MKHTNRLAHLLRNRSDTWPSAPKEMQSQRHGWGCEDDEPQGSAHWPAKESKVVQDLLKQLLGQADENVGLREELEGVKNRLNRCEALLTEIFDPQDLPELGEFEKWLTSEEAKKLYRGKHIAYIEGKGVVESAPTIKKLVEKLEKLGNPTGVMLGAVSIPSVLA